MRRLRPMHAAGMWPRIEWGRRRNVTDAIGLPWMNQPRPSCSVQSYKEYGLTGRLASRNVK